MITVFNRKELIITMEMNRQAEVRNILSQNGIDYTVKTTNLQTAPLLGSRMGRTGSFGIKTDNSYEYKIYVHKKDFEKAVFLIKWLVENTLKILEISIMWKITFYRTTDYNFFQKYTEMIELFWK